MTMMICCSYFPKTWTIKGFDRFGENKTESMYSVILSRSVITAERHIISFTPMMMSDEMQLRNLY